MPLPVRAPTLLHALHHHQLRLTTTTTTTKERKGE
jgi:hypothetical protein